MEQTITTCDQCGAIRKEGLYPGTQDSWIIIYFPHVMHARHFCCIKHLVEYINHASAEVLN
jgi:hypothetical protein